MPLPLKANPLRITSNMSAVQANLRQYGERAVARAQGVVVDSADRTFAYAQDSCPRDTNYQAEHMEERISAGGLAYEVGFWREAFVGRTNPVNGRTITFFYPLVNEYGGVHHIAQPCIGPARDKERPQFLRELRGALKG